MPKAILQKTILSFVLVVTLFSHTLAARADTAIFAGGCFWCVEALYQELEGVTDAVSGFTGGTLKNPTYAGNHRGHYEAVKVTYDPEIVSYDELLFLFWVNIDPFNNRGQFCDRGASYRSAIFTSDKDEMKLAIEAKGKIAAKFESEVHTEILSESTFYPVVEGHQDYYLKNPLRYKYYRSGCKRDKRLKEIWGDTKKR